jgi:hypothetical protein
LKKRDVVMKKISTPKKESWNVFSSSKNKGFKLLKCNYEEFWKWVATSNGDNFCCWLDPFGSMNYRHIGHVMDVEKHAISVHYTPKKRA